MDFVAYYRVSTTKQGASGLGLEAQRALVHNYVKSRPNGRVSLEFTEVESGKNNKREELSAALHHCEMTGATLVVSKLDRLSRDVEFIAALMKSDKVKFVIAELPAVNSVTIGIMAVLSQFERDAISLRTKQALAAAKARGVKLGNPRLHEARTGDTSAARAKFKENSDKYRVALLRSIRTAQNEGYITYQAIADRLNEMGVKSRRGGIIYPSTIARALNS